MWKKGNFLHHWWNINWHSHCGEQWDAINVLNLTLIFCALPSILWHYLKILSIQFSHSVMSNSWWPHGLQHTRPPCPSPTPGVYTKHVHLVGGAIQPSHPLFSASPPALNLPSIRVFSNESALCIMWPNIGISASTSVLPVNTQDWSPLRWIGWILLAVQGTQESSPTPQFKIINSLALSFLYSPALTSIHDCWKNHSLE